MNAVVPHFFVGEFHRWHKARTGVIGNPFFIAGINMPLRRSSAFDFAMRGGASKKNLGEVLKMVLAQARSRMMICEYPLATPSNVHPVDCMSFVPNMITYVLAGLPSAVAICRELPYYVSLSGAPAHVSCPCA